MNRWLEKNEPALRLAFRLALLALLYIAIDDLTTAIGHLDVTLSYMHQ